MPVIVDFMNQYSNIIQIILGFLSLMASILVAFLIYWFQKKHEQEIEKLDEQRRKDELKEGAKVFLIDNSEEVDYLPICMIASNVRKFKSTKRLIYSRFNKCSKELQREIINQANYTFFNFEESGWVNAYLEELTRQAEQIGLGISLFYNNFKYFHRAIEYYSDKKLGNIETYVFDVPALRENSAFCKHKSDLTLYIDRYLEFKLRDMDDTKDHPELLPQIPPYDLMYRQFNLGSCSEETMCFWTMKAIYSTMIAFYRHKIIMTDDAEWRETNTRDARIETFEDFYYKTLLKLYVTYAPSGINKM